MGWKKRKEQVCQSRSENWVLQGVALSPFAISGRGFESRKSPCVCVFLSVCLFFSRSLLFGGVCFSQPSISNLACVCVQNAAAALACCYAAVNCCSSCRRRCCCSACCYCLLVLAVGVLHTNNSTCCQSFFLLGTKIPKYPRYMHP